LRQCHADSALDVSSQKQNASPENATASPPSFTDARDCRIDELDALGAFPLLT
jgi:hypothetical protein